MQNLETLCQLICDEIQSQTRLDFEVYLVSRRGVTLNVKDGVEDACDFRQSTGYALRFVDQGHQVFTHSTRVEQGSIRQVVTEALAGLSVVPSTGACLPQLIKLEQPTLPVIADRDFSAVSLTDKWALAFELEKQVKAFDARITQVPFACYEDEYESVLVAHSDGARLMQSRSMVQLSVSVIAADASGDEAVFDHRHSLTTAGLSVAELAQTAAQKAIDSLGGSSMPAATLPAVFAPCVVAEFLEILAPTFFADRLHQQTSRLTGRLGQKVYSPLLNVVDDGLMPGGFGTSWIDAEGVVRRRTLVVENGVFRSGLADSHWGKCLGGSSTGNAFRPHLGASPEVGVSNFYVAAGGASRAELSAHFKTAIEVTDVLGMHLADLVSGDFSVGFQGYWLKEGKRVQPLKSMTMAGNLHDLFGRLVGVGDDLFFYGAYGSPTLLFDQIVISG